MQQHDLRPNILLIMADQLRADVLSCAGGDAGTPALDEIAAEGIRFTECCTVSPLCVPARISLMTGLYPHTTGVWRNVDYVLSPQANNWIKVIQDAGYETSVFGKLHLHTDFGDMINREPLVHRYGFDVVNEVSGPHSTCQTRTYMSEEWKLLGIWDKFCEDMLSRTKGPYAKPSPLSAYDYYDSYVGRKAKEYLQEYIGTKPWFCYVSFPGPHEPWDAPFPYSEMYSPEKMKEPLPPVQDMNPGRARGEYDKLLENKIILCTKEESKKIQANYCGSVSLIDERIGEIIDVIKSRGEWDNTVVIFTSDHGELNGDHGLVHKRNFFRSVLNVPLIIRTPITAKRGGSVSDTLINLLDIGPTATEFAGKSLTYEQFGKSLCPYLDNMTTVHRNSILSEYNGELMYYDKDWKMVVNKNGEAYLLFDEINDPQELNNLAAMPEYAETEKILKNRLLDLLLQNTNRMPHLTQTILDEKSDSFSRCIPQE